MLKGCIETLASRHDGEYSGVKVKIDPSTFSPNQLMALVGTEFKCKGNLYQESDPTVSLLWIPPSTRERTPFDLNTWLRQHQTAGPQL